MLVLPEDVQVLRRYIANILANHDEPDAEGIKLQLIYDRIDMRNE